MSNIPRVTLMIESSRGFGRDLLTGIAKYSRLHGPWTFCRQPPFFRETGSRAAAMKRLKKWNTDGIILRDVKNIETLVDLNLPTVIATTILDDPQNFPSVNTDNKAIAELAAQHLINRGFKQFAYCGFTEIGWSGERGKYFKEVVEQAGYSVHEYTPSRKKPIKSYDIEQQYIAEWLKKLPKPIGLMTCTDERSLHIIEACKIADIHVPEEIAVIGVDNDKLECNLSNPPLSSVALATVKGGYEVAELLDKLMHGEKMVGQKIIVPPTYIETRQSTNILAIEDQDVANAIRFIHNHSRELIGVSDISESISVSRRILERKFRRVLHRSILDEIRRIRVEQIAKLVTETNLPVSQIAAKLGYASVAHIARYFRKEKNISLLEYRKRYGQK